MSAQDEDTEKAFDATPQKLFEARRKGEVAKSNDLMTAAAYAGLLIAVAMAGGYSAIHASTVLQILLDQPDRLAPLFFGAAVSPPIAGLANPILVGLSPLFFFPAAAVLLSIFAQRALVFAPSKLIPKLSRLSLVSNAKNKFGRDGLFEFSKSFFKLITYTFVVALFIKFNLSEMISVIQGEPNQVLILLFRLCSSLLLVVVAISSGIGIIDAFWQHFSHLRKNRMSRKEILDETKNSEGDPHLKQERRQRAMSVAQRQMMADVPEADVIIVNPTHFAVALKWSRQPGDAPICVAKGVDDVAATIRVAAEKAGVPIHHDPPTARSICATIQIGEQISPNFYKAVAAAIRFAESLRNKGNFQI
jgi:flagellar biosynthetic protein FlhB